MKNKKKKRTKQVVFCLSSNDDSDIKKLEIFITSVPSLNNRLILHSSGKRFILDTKYREVKNLLSSVVNTHLSSFSNANNHTYRLNLDVTKISKGKYLKIDVDNVLKLLLDSIKNIVGDDNLITELCINKKYMNYNRDNVLNIIEKLSSKIKDSIMYLINEFENSSKKTFGFLISFNIIKLNKKLDDYFLN